MALACTWGGYADTDLKLSEFFGSDHTVAVRFMLQHPKAYVGPMLSVKGSGTYLIGQGDHGPSGPVNLIVKIGSDTQASAVTVEAPLAAGTWHHLAVVRTGGTLPVDPLNAVSLSVGGTLTVYVDGKPSGSMNLLPGPGPSGTLRMGKTSFDAALDAGADQFYGLLDDVAVFTAALSPSDVAALAAAAHLTGTEANLHAGFTFGYTPPSGVPAKLARPVTLSGASSLREVSVNRDNAADAKLLPLPWTGHLHVPFPPGETWRVVQGYEGNVDHQGFAAFCLDLVLEPDPAKSAGRPFAAAAPGTVDFVKQDAAPGGASNFITVRHGDHEFCDYLHLASGSAVVKAGDHVAEGEQLAAVGSTGASGPHLHLAVTNLGEAAKGAGGRFVTIPAALCRYRASDDGGSTWQDVSQGIPQEGQLLQSMGPIPHYGPGTLGWDQEFWEAGVASGGPVSEVAEMTLPGTSRLVTAVRGPAGSLRFDVWDVDDASCVVRKGSGFAGPVSAVSVCALSAGRVATAVREGSGNLKVIIWDVDGIGQVRRRGSHSAGPVSKLAVASLTPGRCATAVRDASGNLKIIVWDIASDGTVTRRGDATAGPVSLVAVTCLTGSRLCSAVRDENGNLQVIVWEVDGSGNVTRRADATAGAVDAVAVGTYGPTAAMTYVRDSTGHLKLIFWYLEGSGLVRGVDHQSDSTHTDIATVGAGICAFTAGQFGAFFIRTWNVTAGSGPGAGTIQPRTRTLITSEATKVNVSFLPPPPKPPGPYEVGRIAAACRNHEGELWISVSHSFFDSPVH
jgi:murein DD-endopeptidase MepM/ murein hydrolase activator NlpD